MTTDFDPDHLEGLMGRLRPRLSGLREVAGEASQLMRRTGETNGYQENVLAIDRQVESAALEWLSKESMVGDVYSEDSGLVRQGPGPLTAVLDPVDGSRNYGMGLSYYAVSLALVDREGSCQAGIVANLVTGKSWSAVRGRGAFVDTRPLRTKDTGDLHEVDAIFVGLSHDRQELGVLSSLAEKLSSFRAMGCSALDLCCLAEGRTALFLDLSRTIKVVDVLAAALIVSEAGGAVITEQGQRVENLLNGSGDLVNRSALYERPRIVGLAGPRIQDASRAILAPTFPAGFAATGWTLAAVRGDR